MAEISKRLKRLLHEYGGKAHEAELREALVPLAEAFKRWERGEIDSFELKDMIHRFHQGPRARSGFATTAACWGRKSPTRSRVD
jgi:hypothetical protein